MLNDNENRVETIRKKINDILNGITDENYRHTFYVHLYGVASFAALLASRRGLDMELAYVAGLMHDVSLLTNPDEYENHCANSAQTAGEILAGTGLFTEGEINIVTNAILYHNDTENTHSPYDEILKDADILQPFFNDIPEPAWQPAKSRLEKILTELNIPLGIINKMEYRYANNATFVIFAKTSSMR